MSESDKDSGKSRSSRPARTRARKEEADVATSAAGSRLPVDSLAEDFQATLAKANQVANACKAALEAPGGESGG